MMMMMTIVSMRGILFVCFTDNLIQGHPVSGSDRTGGFLQHATQNPSSSRQIQTLQASVFRAPPKGIGIPFQSQSMTGHE